ncbi:MAG: SpoIIE family protein phosphatase, partial [Bacteroidales bacterium]|nr:SpoIIE family protein phosphatase [Bacteroidales bacterium]
NEYTNHSVSIKKGDMIYLFSDGYPDQFGGPTGKKFMYRRFRHMLLTIHKLPLQEQKDFLENSIEDWKGEEYDQVDDILVIGIRPV